MMKILASLSVVLLLGGCGLLPARPRPAEPAPTAAETPPNVATTTAGAPGPTTAAKPPPTKVKKRVQVAWAPDFGPISQDQPPLYRWYQRVEDRDCAGLLDVTESEQSTEFVTRLYRGLAHACALKWADAKADLRVVEADTEVLDAVVTDDCLAGSAVATLRRLVAAHEQAPDAEITLGPPVAATCTIPPQTEGEQP